MDKQIPLEPVGGDVIIVKQSHGLVVTTHPHAPDDERWCRTYDTLDAAWATCRALAERAGVDFWYIEADGGRRRLEWLGRYRQFDPVNTHVLRDECVRVSTVVSAGNGARRRPTRTPTPEWTDAQRQMIGGRS